MQPQSFYTMKIVGFLCLWTVVFFGFRGIDQTPKQKQIGEWNKNVEAVFYEYDLETVSGMAETEDGHLWCVGMTEKGIYWIKIQNRTGKIIDSVFTKIFDTQVNIHSFRAIGNGQYAIVGTKENNRGENGWLLVFDESGQKKVEKNGARGTAFFDFVTMENEGLLISGVHDNKMALFAWRGQNFEAIVCEECYEYSEGRGIARNLADEIFITGYEQKEKAKTPTLKIWKYVGHLNNEADRIQEVKSIDGAKGITIASTYGENCLLDYSFGVLAKDANDNHSFLLRINPNNQTVDVDMLAEFEGLSVPTAKTFLTGGYYDSTKGSQNLFYWVGGLSSDYHRFARLKQWQLHGISVKIKDNQVISKKKTYSKIKENDVSSVHKLRNGNLILGGGERELGYLHQQEGKPQLRGGDCQMMLAFSKKNKGTVLYAGSEEMRTTKNRVFITPKIISKNPMTELTIRFDKNDGRGLQQIYHDLVPCEQEGEKFETIIKPKEVDLYTNNRLFHYELGRTLQLNLGINKLNFTITDCKENEISDFAKDYVLNYSPIDVSLWSIGVPSNLKYTEKDAENLCEVYRQSNQEQFFKSIQINCSIDSVSTTAAKMEEFFCKKSSRNES